MSQGPARAENHTHKTVVHANHFRWSWLRGSYNDTVSKDHIGTISIIFQGVTRFSLAVGTRYLRPKLYTGLFRGEGPTAILCPAVCASSPLPSPSLSPPPPPPREEGTPSGGFSGFYTWRSIVASPIRYLDLVLEKTCSCRWIHISRFRTMGKLMPFVAGGTEMSLSKNEKKKKKPTKVGSQRHPKS